MAHLTAQVDLKPIAKFSFNDLDEKDEVSKQKASLVGASFVDDRFGNANSAVNLSGHEFSYINLGTSRSLKPKQGSISMWVNITRPVFYGTGYKHNPILLTKSAPRDDFYESYAIYLDVQTNRIFATCANDSASAPNIYDMTDLTLMNWHHLVLCYNNHELAFYVNGRQAGRTVKNFETMFNPLDSVMIGNSANKKNNRFTFGVFDDIEFYDKVLNEAEIEALYRAPNPKKYKIILNWVLIILLITGAVAAVYFLVKQRFSVLLKKEKERLELDNKLLENELRINRALMNPHFIFNAMNTLHSHILTNSTDLASDYLVKFSRLIRKILDSNMADTLTLDMEIDLITRYLELEDLRFQDRMKYEVIVEPGTPTTACIPIMMVQPFVENSIWHGLRDKKGEKRITISFSVYQTTYLKCVIDDNGSGRKTVAVNPAKKSLSTHFVQQRLDLLNKIHHLSCSLEIIDKPEGNGTTVILILPILNR